MGILKENGEDFSLDAPVVGALNENGEILSLDEPVDVLNEKEGGLSVVEAADVVKENGWALVLAAVLSLVGGLNENGDGLSVDDVAGLINARDTLVSVAGEEVLNSKGKLVAGLSPAVLSCVLLVSSTVSSSFDLLDLSETSLLESEEAMLITVGVSPSFSFSSVSSLLGCPSLLEFSVADFVGGLKVNDEGLSLDEIVDESNEKGEGFSVVEVVDETDVEDCDVLVGDLSLVGVLNEKDEGLSVVEAIGEAKVKGSAAAVAGLSLVVILTVEAVGEVKVKGSAAAVAGLSLVVVLTVEAVGEAKEKSCDVDFTALSLVGVPNEKGEALSAVEAKEKGCGVIVTGLSLEDALSELPKPD